MIEINENTIMASDPKITPKAAKLTELDIYRVTGHAPYGCRGWHDGYIFNNAAHVKDIHKSLDKPVPENVDHDAIVDLSEFLSRLWTKKEIAEAHDIPLELIQLRIEFTDGPESLEVIQGLDDDGEALYYLDAHAMQEWVIKDEVLTLEELANRSRHSQKAIKVILDENRIDNDPYERQEGDKTVTYYSLSSVNKIFEANGRCAL